MLFTSLALFLGFFVGVFVGFSGGIARMPKEIKERGVPVPDDILEQMEKVAYELMRRAFKILILGCIVLGVLYFIFG